MRIANRDCGPLVARREPFTGSNLQGGPRGTVGSFGLLPVEWRRVYQAAILDSPRANLRAGQWWASLTRARKNPRYRVRVTGVFSRQRLGGQIARYV